MKINSNQIHSNYNIYKNSLSKTSQHKTEIERASTVEKRENVQKRDIVEINSLKDTKRMKEVIQNSIQDGIALVQTMDRALEKAENIGKNLKDLATTYKKSNGNNKEQIEKEATKLLDDLGSVLNNAKFKGEKVFEKKNHSIYTGETSTYNIKTPNVSLMKEIAEINQEKSKTHGNAEQKVSQRISNNVLNLSLLQAVSSFSKQPVRVEDYLTTKEDKVTSFSKRNVATQGVTSISSTASSKQSGKLSKQQEIQVQDTLENVFKSKKEMRDFFDVKNEKELRGVLEQETSESLRNRFLEKGYTEEYQKAMEEGLFKNLGLQNPSTDESSDTTNQDIVGSVTDKTPTQPDISTILNPDYINDNILNVIEKEREILNIHESMLKSKLKVEEKVEGKVEDTKKTKDEPIIYDLYEHVSKVNIAKLQNHSLSKYSSPITFHNIDTQKEGVLQLLRQGRF